MAQNFIDLEWWRDLSGSGYELRAAEPAQSRSLPVDEAATLRVTGFFNITIAKPQQIVWRGDRLERYQPLELFPKLFERFARVTSPTEMLLFVNQFGPLTNPGRDPSRGESVSNLIIHAGQMKQLLDAHTSGRKEGISKVLGPKGLELSDGPIGELDARLVFDPALEMPRLHFKPKNLINAIWLQLAQYLTKGTPRKTCLHCSSGFDVGPGTGRRADAKFCSDEHQVAFNSRKRSAPNRAIAADLA